jgi:hypothetical protein
LNLGAIWQFLEASFGFSAFWEIVSIVLSALFGFLSLAGENRDVHTHKLTVRGKVYLVLTLVALSGGIIAQLVDNATLETARRAADARNEASLRELSRLLQPIGHPTLQIEIKLDCEVYKFCAELRHDYALMFQHKDYGRPESKSVPDIPIAVDFYKDTALVEKRLRQPDDSQSLIGKADLFFNVHISRENVAVIGPPTVTEYRNYFSLSTHDVAVEPQANTSQIMSVADLPGSTVILTANGMGDYSGPFITLRNNAGQRVIMGPFKIVRTLGPKPTVYFRYTFPKDRPAYEWKYH